MEIIARIGVAKRPAHSLWQKYEYSGSSSILNWAEGELNGAIDKNSIVWGVYTHNKEHAKALAVVLAIHRPQKYMVQECMVITMTRTISCIFGLEADLFIKEIDKCVKNKTI